MLDASVYAEPEQFYVELSQVTNAEIARGTAVGLIVDLSTTQPSLQVSNAVGFEGQSLSFTVSLSMPVEQVVYVYYYTESVTAQGGLDFGELSGVLEYYPGLTSQTILIETFQDGESAEDTEQFKLVLSSSSTISLGVGEGLGETYNLPGA
jgi:hypothetical protein